MKNTFLKFWLLLALGLTTAVFYSCSKEDEKEKEKPDTENQGGKENSDGTFTITATNVIDGSSKIATVKAEIMWETGDYDYGRDVIAQAQYQNNGFTLKLPATLSAKYLRLIAEDAPDGVAISDKTAKSTGLHDIMAYDKDKSNIGSLYFEGNNEGLHDVMWLYVDKNVTVKGEYRDEDERVIYKYDMNLKKGWNAVYFTETKSHNFTITSQKPAGVNYSWYFYSYDDDFRSAKSATKSVENKKSVFSKLEGDRRK
jgi:hypothetical protein